MNNNNSQDQDKKKKIAAVAVVLLHEQEALLHILRGYDSPAQDVDVIKIDKFQSFKREIDHAIATDQTKSAFGLEKPDFDLLVSIFRQRQRASRIPVDLRIAIFLKFSREGRTQNYLAKDIGISQATVSRIIQESIHDLTSVSGEYIQFPTTREEIEAMTAGFSNKSNGAGGKNRIPCFGCLDGKHWSTEHPPNSGSLNANYKSYFSFNSLFVCDSQARIFFLQLSELGINSDSQMYRDGPLPRLLTNSMKFAGFHLMNDKSTILPHFLIADNGFALTKSVMQPYRQRGLTEERMKFNRRISAVRVRVENLFGIMTAKFQVFDRSLKLSPQNSRALIVALSVIHNIQIGPLICAPENDSLVVPLPDPYNTPEDMRTALKDYILND